MTPAGRLLAALCAGVLLLAPAGGDELQGVKRRHSWRYRLINSVTVPC